MPQFVQGKKTYAVAAIAALIGVDQALIQAGFHIPAVPGWVLFFLGAAGLYSVRNGITTDTQKAVSDVLAQVTIPAQIVVTPGAVDAHADDKFFNSGPKMAGKI